MRRAMIFKSRWGWMGVAESEKGIAAIVLPQASKAAVAAGLRAHVAGWNPHVVCSSPRLLPRDALSTTGMEHATGNPLWPTMVLPRSGLPRRRSTIR